MSQAFGPGILLGDSYTVPEGVAPQGILLKFLGWSFDESHHNKAANQRSARKLRRGINSLVQYLERFLA